MEKQINIKEVLSLSESMNLEKKGVLQLFNPFTIETDGGITTFMGILVLIMFLLVVLWVLALIAQRFHEGSFLENLVFGAFLLALTVGFGVSVTNSNEFGFLTPESQQEYKSMESKWMRELATPYVEQLPLESVTGIAEVEYDYDLETNTPSPPKNKVPVKVTADNGETYSLWAEVVELEENVPSILTFTTIKEDLRFHEYSDVAYEKGYYNGKLYTNEKL